MQKAYHIDSKNITQNWKKFYMCISINTTKLIKIGKLCRQGALNVRGFLVSAAQKRGGTS